MDNGQLVACGTHEHLLNSCKQYQNMWTKQSEFYISYNGRKADMTTEHLKLIELFSDLHNPLLEEIISYMDTEHFEEQQTVIQQGEEGDKFYIIVRGRVEVMLEQELNSMKRLAVLEDGDYFGEMALLKEIPRTATIRTLNSCTLLSMKRSHFYKILDESTSFRQRIEEAYGIRLQSHKN